MYSRVQLTISTRDDALTDARATRSSTLAGRTGVFIAAAPENGRGHARRRPPAARACMTAKFMPVEVGIRDGEVIEITKGLDDGARVITTGASALKDGDRIVAANAGPRPRTAKAPAAGVRSTGHTPQGSGR